MKFTKRTIDLIQHSKKINSFITLNKHSEIRAVSSNLRIALVAECDEVFPYSFYLENIDKFYKPSRIGATYPYSFEENKLITRVGEFYNANFTKSWEKKIGELKTFLEGEKRFTLGNILGSFYIDADEIKNLIEKAKALHLPHLMIYRDKEEDCIISEVCGAYNSTSNSYRTTNEKNKINPCTWFFGEPSEDINSKEDFNIWNLSRNLVLDLELVKLLYATDYMVEFVEGLAMFRSLDQRITHSIILEHESLY